MEYIYRINLGSKIGLGHFTRIKYLIKNLKIKNYKIIIDKKPKLEFLHLKQLKIHYLYEKNNSFKDEKTDAKKFLKYFNKNSTVIVDDYRLGYNWEKVVRSHCGKLICIDDFLNKKHYSDIYINTKPELANFKQGDMNQLKSLNKKNCTFLLGPKFSMINPDLKKITKKKSKFSITFYNGGSGKLSIYKEIIKTLNKSHAKNFIINIIIGPFCMDGNKIILDFKKYKNIKFFKNLNNLSSALSNTDLLISSAGIILYEAAYFKIPTILIQMNKNQETLAEDLQKIGHYFFLNKKEIKDTNKFNNLILSMYKNYKNIKKLIKNPSIKVGSSKNILIKSIR